MNINNTPNVVLTQSMQSCNIKKRSNVNFGMNTASVKDFLAALRRVQIKEGKEFIGVNNLLADKILGEISFADSFVKQFLPQVEKQEDGLVAKLRYWPIFNQYILTVKKEEPIVEKSLMQQVSEFVFGKKEKGDPGFRVGVWNENTPYSEIGIDAVSALLKETPEAFDARVAAEEAAKARAKIAKLSQEEFKARFAQLESDGL